MKNSGLNSTLLLKKFRMPKILIVSATAAEIAPLLEKAETAAQGGLLSSPAFPDLFVVITGAGMVNTAFELGKLIGYHFDVAVNAGICGCFTGFKPGDVLRVSRDCFCEMGAEDDQKFISVDELKLGEQYVDVRHPFSHPLVDKLPSTNGITVNTVHGNEKSIARVTERYQPHVESMEGAAFLHAANAFNWKCVQLRAVSNMVTKRNRASWKVDLAIKNLNDVLIALVESLSTASTL